MVLELISSALIMAGCLLGLIGGLGMHRLTDFYSRLHAVGVTDTLCSFLILSGLALNSQSILVAGKLLLVFAFLFFTSPTASYSLANNAWRWGLRPDATRLTSEGAKKND